MGILADYLADNNFGDTRSGGLAGPMGLLLIVVLGAATVLLIRNMGKRIKRLPASFDGSADLPQATPAAADAVPAPRNDDPEVIEHVKGRSENLP